MSDLKTWNLKQVTATIGVVTVEGGNESDFVDIQFGSPDFEVTVSAFGDVIRNRSLDGTATLSLTCMQTHGVNKILDGIRRADTRATDSGSGSAIFPIRLEHEDGDTFVATKAFIMGPPGMSFNKSAGQKVWQIFCVDGKINPGTSHKGLNTDGITVPDLVISAGSLINDLLG